MEFLEVDVRPVTATDLPAIAAVKPSWTQLCSSLMQNQESGACLYLVALAEGLPVGLAELTRSESPELRNLHVLAAWRGRGIGSQIIAAAERLSASAGELRIGVGDDNPRARALYERLGYEATGESERYRYRYLDDSGIEHEATETSIMLRKRLDP